MQLTAMCRRWAAWLGALVFLCLAGPLAVSGQEIDFDITQIDIQAEILADGDVRFRQVYHYDVDYFNGAEITIDSSGKNILDYQVGVQEGPGQGVEPFAENHSTLPGSFQSSRQGDLLTFRIHQPTEDAQVSIVVEFTLEEVVTNYADTAQFNWHLLGQDIPGSPDIQGRILLPGPVQDPEDFRAWGHGAPQGEVYPRTEGGQSWIDVSVPNKRPSHFVEVNAIFPKALTPNNSNIDDRPMKANIIEGERAQLEADQAARDRSWKVHWALAIVAGLVTVGVTLYTLYYVWTAQGRANPKPAHVPAHVYSLPEDLPPAIMATAVLRQQATADDFSATLLDLARKGYVQLEEVKKERRGLFRRGEESSVRVAPGPQYGQRDRLYQHEVYVLDYVLEGGQATSLYAIEQAIQKDKGYKKRQYKLWDRFVKNTEIKGDQVRGPVPKEKWISEIWLAISLVLALGVPIGLAILWTDGPLSQYLGYLALAGLGNFLLVVLALVRFFRRPIRSYDQDKRARSWKAFADMLDNVGNMNMRDLASLPLWEEYLVYAVSLGVADKVVEAMNDTYGLEELETLQLPISLYRQPVILRSAINNSLARSIASSAPASSQFKGNNTGGFGGGFSGGSSGGGGGGGGAGGF